jgi:uncharacterized ferritin-like protein (DUF455 family)
MTAYPNQLLAVIAAPTSREKASLIGRIEIRLDGWTTPALPPRPGRPAHYRESSDLPKRRRTLKHAPTRNRFLAAIHHIELSAIDLAVLCCLRAPDMDEDFHRDELAVAGEEAVHAGLLEDLLRQRGIEPGTEPVHHRLWESALVAADLGEQLVIVPRFLEARGLDVSAEVLPRMKALDTEAHAVLERIYTDEIRHVGIGTRWHRVWCERQGLDPAGHFETVVRKHFATQIPGPWALDYPGRTLAGFSTQEMAVLSAAPTGRLAHSPGQRPG